MFSHVVHTLLSDASELISEAIPYRRLAHLDSEGRMKILPAQKAKDVNISNNDSYEHVSPCTINIQLVCS